MTSGRVNQSIFGLVDGKNDGLHTESAIFRRDRSMFKLLGFFFVFVFA